MTEEDERNCRCEGCDNIICTCDPDKFKFIDELDPKEDAVLLDAMDSGWRKKKKK